MKKLSIILLAATALSFPSLTYAQDNDEDVSAIDIGGTVLLRQSYVGSDRTETNILPYLGLDNVYGFDLLGPTLKYQLFDVGTGRGFGKWSVRAGPRAAFDFGRDSDDSPTLDGLEDIDSSLLLGGYLRSSWGPVGFDIAAGQDVIGGHDGFLADFSLGTRYPGNGWYIQPAVTLSWADGNYAQTTYGITAEQALNSALGEFDSSSGFHQASATILGGFEINKDWNFTALFSYREALGDYRDSPIITAEDGSTSGIFTSLSISRRFNL